VSRRGSPVLIGGFVVAALALTGAAVVFFGTGAFLKQTTTYVMFFEGDVSGLRVGAPVTFRGVPVGKVSAIRASLQRRGERVETRVAVYAELDQGVVEAQTGFGVPAEEVYRLLIENGMRAQLQMQSFVTGQLFVQLDFHEDQPAIFVGGDESVRELPTIPTPLELVTRSARRLLERIGELPLEDIIENLNTSLAAAGRMLDSDGAQRLPEELAAATRDLSRLASRLDGRTAVLAEDLEQTLASARGTLDELNGLIGDLGRDSGLQYELGILLRETSAAARAMRVLAETLEQHPEALLSGRGADPGGP
jgi:paraquat-inducible protein B